MGYSAAVLSDSRSPMTLSVLLSTSCVESRMQPAAALHGRSGLASLWPLLFSASPETCVYIRASEGFPYTTMRTEYRALGTTFTQVLSFF